MTTTARHSPSAPRATRFAAPLTRRRSPSEPRKHSNWPDYRSDGRPRSATIVIRKLDGGVIGS